MFLNIKSVFKNSDSSDLWLFASKVLLTSEFLMQGCFLQLYPFPSGFFLVLIRGPWTNNYTFRKKKGTEWRQIQFITLFVQVMLQSIETPAPRPPEYSGDCNKLTVLHLCTLPRPSGKYVGTIPALVAPVCTIFWRLDFHNSWPILYIHTEVTVT